jgi:hypothetical protein
MTNKLTFNFELVMNRMIDRQKLADTEIVRLGEGTYRDKWAVISKELSFWINEINTAIDKDLK